jgi:hypothetical protein
VGIYFSLGTDTPRKARPDTPTPLHNVRMMAPPSTTTSSLHCKAGSPEAQKLLSIFRLRGCCVSLALGLSYSRQVPRLALLASPEASPTRPLWQAICEEPSRRLQKQSGFTRLVLAHGSAFANHARRCTVRFNKPWKELRLQDLQHGGCPKPRAPAIVVAVQQMGRLVSVDGPGGEM